jgi:hypothetical protein
MKFRTGKTNPPVAVVFSDSHLCSRTWKHRSIFSDSFFAFQQIIDFAVTSGLPLIAAEAEPIVFMHEQLQRLNSAGLDFYYVQGQHEMDNVPWLNLAGACGHHLHGKSVSLHPNITLRGLDYLPRDKLQQELQTLDDDFNVLVTHQVWGDFMGDIAMPQGDFSDIPHASLLITGDYHKTVYDNYKNKQNEAMRVYSPGATHLRAINEPATHSFGVLYADGSIKQQPLLSRIVETVEILSESDLAHFCGTALTRNDYFLSDDSLVECLPEVIRKPLLHITYSSKLDGSQLYTQVITHVRDRAHIFWKEIPPEKAEAVQTGVQADFSSGSAVTMCDIKQKPVVFNLAAELLLTPDDQYTRVLSQWAKKQLTNEGE